LIFSLHLSVSLPLYAYLHPRRVLPVSSHAFNLTIVPCGKKKRNAQLDYFFDQGKGRRRSSFFSLGICRNSRRRLDRRKRKQRNERPFSASSFFQKKKERERTEESRV